MTKAAIFSLLPIRPNSTVASTRIGVWLRDLLGVDLFDGPDIANETYDVLFIINGSTLFCKHLPAIAEAVRKAKRVIWIQNDYTLPPPKSVSDAQSPFRKVFADRGLVPDYWTTCRENAKLTPDSAEVNWNCLGMELGLPQATLNYDDWLYYGAYREGRAASFEYVDKMLPSWTVSSTSKKFNTYANVWITEPMPRASFHATLTEYGMGIYMQDAKSAPKAHSPATRFYEMLSVGLPMAFTPDCVPTLAQYGFDVAPYVIKPELMQNRKWIADKQHSDWYANYPAALAIHVKELAKGLGL